MKIKITQQIVNEAKDLRQQGLRTKQGACPVTLALLQMGYDNVKTGYFAVTLGNAVIWLPDEITKMLILFDSELPILTKDLEFEI